jgi:hypothetical protein
MASSCLLSSMVVRRMTVGVRVLPDSLTPMLNGQPFFDESFGVAAPDPTEFPELERGNVAPSG